MVRAMRALAALGSELSSDLTTSLEQVSLGTSLSETGRVQAAKIWTVPICKSCGEEVEELVTLKVGGKSRKLCEDCADRLKEEDAVAEQSESVVQNMMGFKGRR